MASRIPNRSAGPAAPSAPPPSRAIPWSILAWPLCAALGVLLIACLIFWRANASEAARLNEDLAKARDALQAIPSPQPEIRSLSDQVDLAIAQRNALGAFYGAITGGAALADGQHDWSSILSALLDHDAQRVYIRTIYQNGDLLSVSGLAVTRDDVAAYVDRLNRSSVFEQVSIQSLEEVAQDLPPMSPSAATSVPMQTTPTAAPPTSLLDGYEIDDFQAGPITPNDVQQHSFSPVADIDQVQFVARAGQRYCILALPQSADADPVLDVYVDGAVYSNDNCLAQQTPLSACLCPSGSTGSALAALVEIDIPASGDHTVQVRVRNQGTYGPNARYLLSVSVQAQPVTSMPGDAYEPDDVAPRALALYEQQLRTFYPSGDVDRVLFDVQAGRIYELKTYNLSTGVDTDLSVSVGGVTFSNDNIASGNLSSQVTFVSPIDGQATALVTNKGQYGVDEGYWLTVTGLGPTATLPALPTPMPPPPSCGDPYEPDDVFDRPIRPGEPQRRSFCPPGDVDRVVFTAQAHHRYRILTEALAPQVDTVLRARMGAMDVANDNRAPGDRSSMLELANGGSNNAIVNVSISNKGQWGPNRTAIVRVDDLGSESADAYEPDQPAKRMISVGEVQRHTFFPGGDIDRLFLVVKAGRRYAVFTCGNATNPPTSPSCLLLVPGVDTVLVVTGPVANCQPPGCQNDDASPGSSHRGSRVEFDAPGSAEVTIMIYNNGSFGPGQEYYVRADEIGVVPATPAPTLTMTMAPTAAPTLAPLPTATPTLAPMPTTTPTWTPMPTVTPTSAPTSTTTQTSAPTSTATPIPTATTTLTDIPTVTPGMLKPESGIRMRQAGLAALDKQQTTIMVRFVLSCKLRDTGR